ncbi:MAG: hypothetical protein AB1486_01600 [Planctomycetota bacterium]
MTAREKGAALLIVLGALVMLVTTAAALARLAGTKRLAARLDQETWIADDLLRELEGVMRDWLEEESKKVSLPPEQESPEVAVLHDIVIAGPTRIEVVITAWDQCGMVPAPLAWSGGALRLGVSSGMARILDRVATKPEGAWGLDLLAGLCPGMAIFPRAASTPAVAFGGEAEEIAARGESRALDDAEEAPGKHRGMRARDRLVEPALGAFVATHNPDTLININTAPRALLEAALRLSGRGGLEMILEHRRHGTLAPVPAAKKERPSEASDPVLVSTSPVWAFRIDIRVGRLARSWWAIYREREGRWSCAQRLCIPD